MGENLRANCSTSPLEFGRTPRAAGTEERGAETHDLFEPSVRFSQQFDDTEYSSIASSSPDSRGAFVRHRADGVQGLNECLISPFDCHSSRDHLPLSGNSLLSRHQKLLNFHRLRLLEILKSDLRSGLPRAPSPPVCRIIPFAKLCTRAHCQHRWDAAVESTRSIQLPT